jgi:kinetochore protein Fta7
MATKRKRTSNPEDHDEDTTTRDSKRFAWLKPQVKNVSKHTIKSKWSPLPEPVQTKVRELFRSLERPVIVRQRDERKRIEAQVALGGVVKTYAIILSISGVV